MGNLISALILILMPQLMGTKSDAGAMLCLGILLGDTL
jgi:hypothetical protein